jgi:hypothetical protein
MPNKICTKCKEEKPTEEFYFNSRYGKPIARCKECIAAYRKTPEARAVRNTPERREKRRQYLAQPEVILARRLSAREYNQRPEVIARRQTPERREKRRQYLAQPEVILARRLSAREYNQRPEVIARRQTPEAKARKSAYDKRPENRARARIRDRQPARRKQQDELRSQRRREDPVLNLRFLVSSMVNKGMRKQNVTKNNSTWNALPYTPLQLREHLESQFDSWMNWDNHGCKEGCWSIDHIIPQSSFKFDSMDHPDFQKCWALENLRPLDHWENVKKSNKILKDEEDGE